jgi:hypothetical protein
MQWRRPPALDDESKKLLISLIIPSSERSLHVENERQFPRPLHTGNRDASGPEGADLERIRAEGDGLLDAADKILDSLRPVEAEEYLEQSHQRGGQ